MDRLVSEFATYEVPCITHAYARSVERFLGHESHSTCAAAVFARLLSRKKIHFDPDVDRLEVGSV